MTPELEKVARAIYAADELPNIPTTDMWDVEAPEVRNRYIAMARAALEAIREPLEEARKAAVLLADRERHERADGWEAAEVRWCRLVDRIDHILGKEPTP